jgi:hypothetical protein
MVSAADVEGSFQLCQDLNRGVALASCCSLLVQGYAWHKRKGIIARRMVKISVQHEGTSHAHRANFTNNCGARESA